jgi:hypothetical protein
MSLTPEQRERIQRWVAALRSGEYQQGRFFLKSLDRFCCLGVACDIYAKENPDGKWLHSDFKAGDKELGVTSPPTTVCKWFGLPEGPITAGGTGLITLNDHRNQSFSVIADLIEKEYLTNANNN